MGRRGHAKRSAAVCRPFSLTTILVVLTLCCGLAVRFVPVGLPRGLVKYGGSALWALAIYWLVSAITPLRHLPWEALTAGTLATSVELFKLQHAPGLDAFRHTLPGVLLSGSHFSFQDLLAYWCAVLAGFMLEIHAWSRRDLEACRVLDKNLGVACCIRYIDSKSLTCDAGYAERAG